jgi:acetyl-CoA acetyltransferase
LHFRLSGGDDQQDSPVGCRCAGRLADRGAGRATLNRPCGSGLDALGKAARAIKSGEATLMIVGGVESMSRALFVMPKADSAFPRANADQMDVIELNEAFAAQGIAVILERV